MSRITIAFPVASVFCIMAASSVSLFADDWPQWRGPNHNNVAADGQSAPTAWSAKNNVKWKAMVPGRGHSTPIVVGDLIVLTTADETNQYQAVVAYHRRTGDQEWLTPVSQGGFSKTHQKNTQASPTVAAADGLFFATFPHHNKVGAVALDAKGEIVWQTDVGPFHPKIYEYGYASSPTVYEDTLIVMGECDTSSWMKAIDLKTGRERWKQTRPVTLNWASPIVTSLHGREQLLISGGQLLSSYDPKNGKPLWKAACLAKATCGTAVWDDGIVIAGGGYPEPGTAAVRADGSRQVLWTNNVRCYEQSLLAHAGYVYAFADNGVLYCWNAKTGDEMWKKRLRGPVSASPLLAGDTIYASNERGTTYVFKANPTRFESVAKNQLGDESFASPVVVNGVLYLRIAEIDGKEPGRREYLYAIGE